MNEHSLFIQDDIRCCYIDDFMVLPATQVWANVYEATSDAYQRHEALFLLTH